MNIIGGILKGKRFAGNSFTICGMNKTSSHLAHHGNDLCLLAGDIGGTKTLLQINTADSVLQKSYASADYAGLEEIIADFLHGAGIARVDAACFALAGPVAGRVGRLTNLPWPDVDADALVSRCPIGRVELINDFEAIGHSLAVLPQDSLLTLQEGQAQAHGVRLATGPGTGLGLVWLTPTAHNGYAVHPSESGHADFAPVDELQWDLLRYLSQRHGRATYERVVSGPGLVEIYRFLQESGRATPSPQLLAAMAEGNPAAAISHFAQHEDEAIARMALELFCAVFGAFVGNMALVFLPRGGIYLSGGIPAKIADALKQGAFLRAFRDKGRFAGLLETLPIHIVTDPYPGLLGARAFILDALPKK